MVSQLLTVDFIIDPVVTAINISCNGTPAMELLVCPPSYLMALSQYPHLCPSALLVCILAKTVACPNSLVLLPVASPHVPLTRPSVSAHQPSLITQNPFSVVAVSNKEIAACKRLSHITSIIRVTNAPC